MPSRQHFESGLWVLVAAWPMCSFAQTTEQVVITASGAEQRVLDAPYAVGVVDSEQLRAAGPMINLSEALARVPGMVVANRSNYAQDLQINSRGFGARASFGVRGLRLYADGIPASGPDGQGQVSHFDLAGARRIEVLRGPFSALYGSSSGGVINLISRAPTERQFTLDLDAGSAGLRQTRLGVEAPLENGLSVRAQVAHMESEGFRPQSSAQRTLGNLRLGWEQGADRVVVVLNAVNQPSQDPLGLTRAQFEADPRQTTSVALPQDAPGQPGRFDTRKNMRQEQTGLSWRHRFEEAEQGGLVESQLSAYLGQRSVTQWQSIPVTTQFNAGNPKLTERQSGGVIDFDRDYQGLDGRLVWRWPLAQDRQLQWVAGASVDRSVEQRRGYENFIGSGADQLLGVTGRLRRDESNHLQSQDVYGQAELELSPQYVASLGLRAGRVTLDSTDHYIVGSNGDDSGALSRRYVNPVAALQWRVQPGLNTYLSLGRGFESPTLGELAYRPDGGPGFNTDLKPQTSRQLELGVKWRPVDTGLALDAAVFEARSQNEIGVASNSGGRSTYQNVGRTLRQGAELSLAQQWLPSLRTLLAASWLDATYTDGFLVCAGVPCSSPTVPVPAGNRVAGTLARTGYAELAWVPQAGWELALEARGQGRLPVNDLNSDFAAGFGLLALRARWTVTLPLGGLELLARVDNLADRQVAASVIVNEGNGRYFEPAPGRNMLLSARWRVHF
jgi:iron complex outermembrane recepter protein